MVKTWKADQLFPKILPILSELEQLTGEEFLKYSKIYRPFYPIEEQNDEWSIVLTPHLRLNLDVIYNKSQSSTLYIVFGGKVMLNEFRLA